MRRCEVETDTSQGCTDGSIPSSTALRYTLVKMAVHTCWRVTDVWLASGYHTTPETTTT